MDPILGGILASAIVALVWTGAGRLEAQWANYKATGRIENLLEQLERATNGERVKRWFRSRLMGSYLAIYKVALRKGESLPNAQNYAEVGITRTEIRVSLVIDGKEMYEQQTYTPEQLLQMLRSAELYARVHGVGAMSRIGHVQVV